MQQEPILLINSSKFLGNVLMSLGLVQEFVGKLEASHWSYTLVFDEEFRPIVQPLFDADRLLFYPRRELKTSTGLKRLGSYLGFVSTLRKLKADVAIDLDGNSASSMLSMLSGAKTKIGPFGCPRSHWYTHLSKPKLVSEQSEFYRYRNVLSKVAELDASTPRYGELKLPLLDDRFKLRLSENRIIEDGNLVVCHTGASKARKLWPRQHWIKLIELLQDSNVTPVLVGMGAQETENNLVIASALNQPVINLTGKLSLLELAQLISRSQFFIGNDSGPMHLASALGIEGIGIFGPTYESLWGPLLPNISVLRSQVCPASCNNGHDCKTNISCLTKLTPERVFQEFVSRYPFRTEPRDFSPSASATLATEFQPIPVDDQRDSAHSIDRLTPHSAAP